MSVDIPPSLLSVNGYYCSTNHMEYALLRCPFIFVKRMKNRFSSELYYAVLFCRDALDFGYFSVFVHVLGRGGEGHIFVEAFS